MLLGTLKFCVVCGLRSQGRLTLLLGPPGSGKSTLLRALAGTRFNTHLVQDQFSSSLCQCMHVWYTLQHLSGMAPTSECHRHKLAPKN